MLQVVAHPHTSLGLEPLVHKKPKSTCISTSAAHGSLLNTLGSSSQFPWEKLLDPARNFEDHSFLKLGKEFSESMCTFLDLCSQYSKHRTGKSTALRDRMSNISAQLGQMEAHLNPIFTELQTLFTDLLPQSNKFQPDSQSFYACHRRIGELKTQLFAALPRLTSMNTLLCEKRKGLLTGVTSFTVTKIYFPPKLFLNNMSSCFFWCADMRRRVNQLREPKKHPSLNVDIPSNDVRFFCFNLTLNLKKSRSLISSALITIPFVSNEYLMQLCILLEKH